jgi:hypothetical protein
MAGFCSLLTCNLPVCDGLPGLIIRSGRGLITSFCRGPVAGKKGLITHVIQRNSSPFAYLLGFSFRFARLFSKLISGFRQFIH